MSAPSATAPAAAPPPAPARPARRGVELSLIVAAVLVSMYGYAEVGLARHGAVPPGALGYGCGLAALALVAHVAVRARAPYADPLLLPIALLLNGLGLVLIYRLDLEPSLGPRAAPAQLVWSATGVGLFALVVLTLRDHRVLARYAYVSVTLALLLLVAPIAFPAVNGAKIWVRFAGLSFQPGEFAKLLLAVFFAGYLSANRAALAYAGRRLPWPRLPLPRMPALRLRRLRPRRSPRRSPRLSPRPLTWLRTRPGTRLRTRPLTRLRTRPGTQPRLRFPRRRRTCPPGPHAPRTPTPRRRSRGPQLPTGRVLGPVLAIWLVSVGVLVVERDLGTSMLFFCLFVVMLYVATGRSGWIAVGLLLASLGAGAAGVLEPHVHSRVQDWLHPFATIAAGQGPDQIAQSLFAFAGGGLLGAGLGQGASYLIGFAAKSDFVLATAGEELGFAGLCALFALYALLIGRGFQAGLSLRDPFGRLLATGLASILALQVFVIAGGVMDLIPLTGMAMPFLAQGGSSVVTNWIIVAVLIRISDRARRPEPAGAGPEASAPAREAVA